MPEIEPNSPEALKLAQKVRNIYYFVAALNFVVIAIIALNVWSNASAAEPAKPEPAKPDPTKPDPAKPDPAKPGSDRRGPSKGPPKPVVVAKTPEDKAAIAEMEALNERVLASYASGDGTAFAREFSPNAIPKADEHFFKNVIVDLYQETFGAIVSKKFMAETSANKDFGMLVYECACKKRPKAKLSVNFRREVGGLKIVQWRMEKM